MKMSKSEEYGTLECAENGGVGVLQLPESGSFSVYRNGSRLGGGRKVVGI